MPEWKTVGWISKSKTPGVYYVQLGKEVVGIITSKMFYKFQNGDIKACPIRKQVEEPEEEERIREEAEEYATEIIGMEPTTRIEAIDPQYAIERVEKLLEEIRPALQEIYNIHKALKEGKIIGGGKGAKERKKR